MRHARRGHIPTTGERFEWETRRFEVIDMDGHRIDKLFTPGEVLEVVSTSPTPETPAMK